jgi:hypothetical protein
MSGYRGIAKAEKAGVIPLWKALADRGTLAQTVTPSHWIAATRNRSKDANRCWRWPLPHAGKLTR